MSEWTEVRYGRRRHHSRSPPAHRPGRPSPSYGRRYSPQRDRRPPSPPTGRRPYSPSRRRYSPRGARRPHPPPRGWRPPPPPRTRRPLQRPRNKSRGQDRWRLEDRMDRAPPLRNRRDFHDLTLTHLALTDLLTQIGDCGFRKFAQTNLSNNARMR